MSNLTKQFLALGLTILVTGGLLGTFFFVDGSGDSKAQVRTMVESQQTKTSNTSGQNGQNTGDSKTNGLENIGENAVTEIPSPDDFLTPEELKEKAVFILENDEYTLAESGYVVINEEDYYIDVLSREVSDGLYKVKMNKTYPLLSTLISVECDFDPSSSENGFHSCMYLYEPNLNRDEGGSGTLKFSVDKLADDFNELKRLMKDLEL